MNFELLANMVRSYWKPFVIDVKTLHLHDGYRFEAESEAGFFYRY